MKGAPITYKGAQGILTVARDISEHNRSEEALHRSEKEAKRLAREQKMDLANVPGSGPGGRIVRRDIEAALAAGVKTKQVGTPQPKVIAPHATIRPDPAQPPGDP